MKLISLTFPCVGFCFEGATKVVHLSGVLKMETRDRAGTLNSRNCVEGRNIPYL